TTTLTQRSISTEHEADRQHDFVGLDCGPLPTSTIHHQTHSDDDVDTTKQFY
ncbi:Hypothetical predicted protein, partial [Olea europaea subsp. europaea]